MTFVSTRTVFFGVALLLAVTAPVSQAEIRARLRPADIEAAIRAGIAGTVAPYALYAIGGDSGRKALAAGRPAPAWVYTPFVRVALHARALYEKEGRTPTADEIAPGALEPVTYIGFNIRQCCDADDDRFNKSGLLNILAIFDPAAFRNAATAGQAMRDPRARPLWITQDTTPLHALGIEPPAHIEAVAAFPVHAATTAREFRLSRYSSEDRATVFMHVAPVPEDVARWR